MSAVGGPGRRAHRQREAGRESRLPTILLAVTAAPALLLALAGWALWRLFRGVAAAAVPRPEESERDSAPLSLLARRRPPDRFRVDLPHRADSRHRPVGMSV